MSSVTRLHKHKYNEKKKTLSDHCQSKVKPKSTLQLETGGSRQYTHEEEDGECVRVCGGRGAGGKGRCGFHDSNCQR